MDHHTPEQRKRNMVAVRGKNTKPEILVRKCLHASGYRYRLHVKELPGSPDIVLPKYGVVIFVHGCFWHQHKGCRKASRPTTHQDFWNKKLEENVKRDKRQKTQLRKLGWKVITIWECQIPAILRKSKSYFRSILKIT